MPYAQVDSIAKMIPNELNITIDKALQMNHELRELYQGNEEVAHLIDMSRRLEGLPRHTSMHAAGVVIRWWNLCRSREEATERSSRSSR